MKPRALLRNAIFSMAKKVGVIAIPEWRLDSYFLAMRLKRIIHEYGIDCIFDVGANVGQYHDFLRSQVAYGGLIISFEPDPVSFAQLSAAQKADSRWIVLNYALGKERKTLDFHIMKSSVFNSFLTPDNSETSRFEDDNVVVNTITMETQRLDDIFDRIKGENEFTNVFLKLDTQGFDLEVLDGATGCLKHIRGVQTEVSVMPIYNNMPSFAESINALKMRGFGVSGIYSVSESRFPHAVECDCIFLPK